MEEYDSIKKPVPSIAPSIAPTNTMTPTMIPTPQTTSYGMFAFDDHMSKHHQDQIEDLFWSGVVGSGVGLTCLVGCAVNERLRRQIQQQTQPADAGDIEMQQI